MSAQRIMKKIMILPKNNKNFPKYLQMYPKIKTTQTGVFYSSFSTTMKSFCVTFSVPSRYFTVRVTLYVQAFENVCEASYP